MAAPFASVIENTDEYIFDYCAKYISRGPKLFMDNVSPNSFNLTSISEDWRFPIVLPLSDSNGQTGTLNQVSFIWFSKPGDTVTKIEVVGNFAPLYKSVALSPVLYENNNIGFYCLTVTVPIGKGYYYRFRLNGSDILDPINPQRKTFSNGKQWSFFFTDFFNSSEEFEEWEINLLYRLANQVVPFRSEDAQNFIKRFYLSLARPDKLAMPIYKLDESVGEVNYITNVLAREERHHLQDYKICIDIIDQLLRKRNPYVDSWMVSEELVNELYTEMAEGIVPGWDYNRYSNPKYFLSLIRRHTITGAFCHPKYGGNVGAAGWNYLKQKYPIKDHAAQIVGSHFNWDLAMEKPMGSNEDYLG